MVNFETMNEYQDLCLRTATVPMDEKTMHLTWSLALAGEVGELANRTKKVFLHGHPYDQEKVIEELGDILWYIAVYSHDIGVDLQEIAQKNITKLEKRYPDGFSSEASQNRIA
jgi:NTP pyrophosphatase (non-canonical NTP hydrolase)